MICSNCDFDSPEGMRFCGGCGSPLQEKAAKTPERRLITVVFCDLVGSTKLSEQLDAEDLREIFHAYQGMASEIVRNYDGHVAQFLGDGILIYFGYPHAHEDDAVRAIRSGLEITAEIEQLNHKLGLPQVKLAVRIGCETGSVVTTELGTGEQREHLALGQTPNIAARLQSLANPNEVVVGEQTWRLIRKHIECESLGAKTLKGISIPIHHYRALRIRESVASSGPEQSKFIGRENELNLLVEQFHAAANVPDDGTVRSHGGSILIRGEAGVGKSRLTGVFKDRISEHKHLWIQASCSAYEQATALHPLIGLLRRVLGFELGRSDKWQLQQLESGLAQFEPGLYEVLPYFASLLNVPLSGKYPEINVSPGKRHAKTLSLLVDLFLGWSRESRVIMLLEDIHWADPTTLKFLTELTRTASNASLYVIATARPTHTPDWADESVQKMDIGPLEPEAIIELASSIGGKPLSPEVADLLVERTDGIPLFVEELTFDLLESGALIQDDECLRLMDSTTASQIPSTLQSSLVARFDRLQEAKEFAQVGAVFGREFMTEDLSKITGEDPATIDSAIATLLSAGLLKQKRRMGRTVHVFKHALVGEAAYEMLLRSTRRELHGKIGAMMETDKPDIVARKPEIVARHFTEAGKSESASAYWLAAGQLALGNSAVAEATMHLEQGLALIEKIEDTFVRDSRELLLQIVLAGTLASAKGFVAPEVRQACMRAMDLAEGLGNATEQFWALIALRLFHLVKGEVHEAYRMCEAARELAEQNDDDSMRSGALIALCTNYFYFGNFQACKTTAEDCLSVTNDESHEIRNRMGMEVAVLAACSRSMSLWHLGEGVKARRVAKETIQLARNIGHGYSLATALVFAGAELEAFAGNVVVVAGKAEELNELSINRGYLDWQLQAALFGGWTGALLADDPEEARESIGTLTGCIQIMKSKGNMLSVSFFLGLLADAYQHLGDNKSALVSVNEGIEAADQTGDRMWEAELHRIKGDILLKDKQKPDSIDQASQLFQTAIDIAEKQGSRALGLRAATSLAALMHQQGRNREAASLLKKHLEPLEHCHEGKDMDSARGLLQTLT